MSTSLSARRGALYVCLSAAAWGTGGAAGKLLFASGGLDAVGVSLWRYLLGALFLLGTGGLVTSLRAARKRHIAFVGAGMALYQTAYFAAIAEAGVAVATVVTMGGTTIVVAAAGRVLLGERIGRVGLAALVAALAGLALLATGTGNGGAGSGGTALGVALSLCSAAGYGAVTLYGRRHRADPTATTVGGFAVGAACLIPFALTGRLLPELTAESVLLLLYLGAVPTALAYALFFRALTAVSATTASVLSLGEAVGAAALGVLVLGEPLTLQAAIGGGVLLCAVVVLTAHQRG
ncbi:DMT family transporter [Thermoactinospora rubra]|uniref:DMT family transporter n=1 Tax=Thermoactinospora rubra TaxID=1088767 RepID=UPI000A106E7A|nr:DMT family transporter [Thermoactinospora rubra]